jgi:hypothetical protein
VGVEPSFWEKPWQLVLIAVLFLLVVLPILGLWLASLMQE